MFREQLKQMRMDKNLTLRKFAELVDIAPSYLSDIEKGYRGIPSDEILNKMIEILELNDEEKNDFLDAAAHDKNTVAKDIASYINDNKAVRVALRRASNINLDEKEWYKIIKDLEKKE